MIALTSQIYSALGLAGENMLPLKVCVGKRLTALQLQACLIVKQYRLTTRVSTYITGSMVLSVKNFNPVLLLTNFCLERNESGEDVVLHEVTQTLFLEVMINVHVSC